MRLFILGFMTLGCFFSVTGEEELCVPFTEREMQALIELHAMYNQNIKQCLIDDETVDESCVSKINEAQQKAHAEICKGKLDSWREYFRKD